MRIRGPADITGEKALLLRQREHLPQHIFWPAVGSHQSMGSIYENGKLSIPPAVQMNLYLLFVEHKDVVAVIEKIRQQARDKSKKRKDKA